MSEPIESCRNCAAKLRAARNGRGWEAFNGFPCIHGHIHEPWPDLLYVDEETQPGVSIMRLISTPPSRPELN